MIFYMLFHLVLFKPVEVLSTVKLDQIGRSYDPIQMEHQAPRAARRCHNSHAAVAWRAAPPGHWLVARPSPPPQCSQTPENQSPGRKKKKKKLVGSKSSSKNAEIC